jgi:2'-5' RNA ligase
MGNRVYGAMRDLVVPERLAFRLAWLVGNAQLRLFASATSRTLPPSGPGVDVHNSVVIRLPADVATSLAGALEGLRELSPHHHYYPPDTMHVTVAVVDGFFPDDLDTSTGLARLRAIVGSHPCFDLTLSGLNVSLNTVFAQVIPHGWTFRSLREHLRSLAKQNTSRSGSAGGFGVVARSLLPHANVVRFSGHVTVEFLEEVSRLRRAGFGRWMVSEVELVRTDRLLSRGGTQVVERMPLAMA